MANANAAVSQSAVAVGLDALRNSKYTIMVGAVSANARRQGTEGKIG